jgi:hypothetical protein
MKRRSAPAGIRTRDTGLGSEHITTILQAH